MISEMESGRSRVQVRHSDRRDAQLVKYSPLEPNESETEPKLDVCEQCGTLSGIVNKLEESQRCLTKLTDEVKTFKIERVEKLKFKNPDKAAKIYEELCDHEKWTMSHHGSEGDDDAVNESELKYLSYRYELFEVLYWLRRNTAGLEITKETWQRRLEPDASSAETKRSYLQYSLMLRALGTST